MFNYITIRSNFVARSYQANILMGGYASNRGNAVNISVVNNTTFHGGTGDGAGEVCLQYHCSNIKVQNNILYGNSGQAYIQQSGSSNTGVIVANNLYYGASTSSPGQWPDASARYADPKLVNTYLDMHLQADSPAIDGGSDPGTTAGTLDIDGQARVQGSAIDLGADEVGGSAANFTITASAGNGGTISPSGAVTVGQGASKTFVIVASSGYTISSVIVDGVSVGAVSSYTFPSVKAAHTISASFTPTSPTSYTITASAGTGGTISPSGVVSVSQGASKTFAIAASSGYTISSVVVDGVSVGAVPSYTFPSVMAAHTINAVFAPVSSATFTIGYSTVFSSTDNGNANVLKAQKVSLSKVAAIRSLSLYVPKAAGKLRLGIYSDANGAPGTLIATTAEILPVTGWNTAVTTTNPSLSAGNYWLVFETSSNTLSQRYQTGSNAIKTRTFAYAALPSTFGVASTDWAVNYSFYATLSEGNTQSYTITASAGTGGTISPSGAISVARGANKTYTITPSNGYAIASVTADGTSVGAVSTYTFSNVQAAHAISAAFMDAGGTGGKMNVMVPAYFDPSSYPTGWSRMATQSAKMPGRVWAIVNPASGPGTAANSSYTSAISVMHTNSGKVIGYVSTSYGARSVSDIKADVDKWYNWYAVDGIFFDEFPWETSFVANYQAIYAYVKSKNSNALVVGNPGGDVQEAYLVSGGKRCADVLCIFETSPGFDTWSGSGMSWLQNYPANSFYVLPYNTASNKWQAYTDRANANYVKWIYCTDDTLANPWDTLPSYFEAQCNYIASKGY